MMNVDFHNDHEEVRQRVLIKLFFIMKNVFNFCSCIFWSLALTLHKILYDETNFTRALTMYKRPGDQFSFLSLIEYRKDLSGHYLFYKLL